jgi:hypothetical protein
MLVLEDNEGKGRKHGTNMDNHEDIEQPLEMFEG